MAFRTKKISQMDPKGSNLASTDLLEISELVSGSYVTKSITGAEIIASVPPTTVEWGGIGGTLSSQTDLQTALNGKVPTTRTLTINGTTQDLSADRTFTISTGITIGTTAITSGTVGRVLFEGTGNVVQQSVNITWDNINNIFNVTGLIKATQNNIHATHVGANIKGLYIVNNSDSVVRAGLQFDGSTAFVELVGRYNNGTPFFRQNGSNGDISFLRSGSEYGRIFGATGNWGINTTTDAGYKLDVNGTARVSGVTLIGSSLISASAYPLQVVGGAGGSALFSNTTRTQALNINLTTSGETRIYVDYFLTGTDQKLILGSYANRANQLVLNTTGNVSIGTTTEITSAILQADSTTRGFLPPRLTTTQKNAIATPATGLVVFDSTLNKLCVRGASAWETITSL